MSNHNKGRSTGSFFSLLAKNQIVFISAFLSIVFLIYGATTIYTSSISYKPKYTELIKEIGNLEAEKYSSIVLNKYLGKNHDMFIFDEEGKMIYSTSKSQFSAFSLDEINCIPDTQEDYIYSVSQYQTSEGTKKLIVQFDEGQTSSDYFNAYSILDEDLCVIEGELFSLGKIFTEDELNLYMGVYSDEAEVRKIKFYNNYGEERYAVFMVKTLSNNKYEQIIFLWKNNWILFIVIYIFMIIISIIWLNKRTKKLLDPLNKAIVDYMNKKDTDLKGYVGPYEFVEIVDNFSELANRLDESEKERINLDEARKKMLADISHDFKTPITVIQGYSNAVKDGIVPENQRERYLDTICKKVDTLSHLIDTFSEYSKLEHPEFVLNLQKTNLCEFFKQLLADKYQELELAGYFLEVDIPDNPIYYEIDRAHMKRVIDNIIGNSQKYNPPKTSIYFSINDDGSSIEITLGDNGVGIPNDIIETIFNPFVIGDEARSNKQGTGLGLSVAKEIVEKHEGKIYLAKHPILPYKTQFNIIFHKNTQKN
ncbi:Signal transduction histidine kinase [Clostridium collagenovorans DSM 3089]|uniref:histidine kinase n=1 Tax=Clostridium collagenovorans DSM 3089 TaxID=1121306 RepID=A0A1M5SGQ4_9CLOT|nr:HAMP domain-containing sensor histidine kinase [Clostridium collagenovorans]SHH37600.1 Signal transduction histidine kinase [Clostridium collagenovorans DSM 3089]